MYAIRSYYDCLCLYVCPTGATDTETGQIDPGTCISGCRLCVDACPSHAISLVPEEYPRQQEKTDRITSYNVCYTKLLRLGNSYSETARINLEREEYTQCIELADKGLELAEDSCSVTSIWWSLFTRSLT